MAEAKPTIECGFCLRNNESLPQPKTLPCTHIHCMDCLVGYYQENNLVMCPVQDCGEVYDAPPDTLPSYEMVAEVNRWCDVCVKKKIAKEEATSYCTSCSKKFCNKHKESHDDTMSEHPSVSMQEYRSKATKFQSRFCTKHEDQHYILGCKLCLTLACGNCLLESGVCDNGVSHNLLSLDDLVAAIMKEDISAEMIAKEDQYEKLFKDTSKARVEYDNKTTEMVQLIRETRDAQVEVFKCKYKKLEDEVIEKRQKSGVAMAEFMEDIVLKKWTQLTNHRKMIESRVKFRHQVDAVKGINELKEEMLKFVEEELPKLKLTNEVELRELDESRVMELEIVSSDDIVIDSEHGVTTLQQLPQSVTLLKSVQLPVSISPSTCPFSVCHHTGSIYVGLYSNTVTRIDNNYQLHDSFIATPGIVESISVYKDRFYTLSYAKPRVVNVYDTSGGHITSWTHPYHGCRSNMLTVVADQVLVADPTNQRIIVYSLTGESLRHIPCPLLSNTFTTMCAVDNTSVVISNYTTSKVFRVNITTGEVVWTFSDVNNPEGLVRYGSYILLAAYDNKTIYILDTTTGNIVSEVADDDIGWDHALSLDVYGTTLVVPKCNNQQVCFFGLNGK